MGTVIELRPKTVKSARAKKPKEKWAARLVLDKPGAMTPAGRKRIAKWLRGQAENLDSYGQVYTTSGFFTARYLYR